jgi:hypothetical protein
VTLFADEHRHSEGLTAEAAAHQRALTAHGHYGVTIQRYWFDERSGTVFCLIEAPGKAAAADVCREAHGLLANEITAVNEGAWIRCSERRASAPPDRYRLLSWPLTRERVFVLPTDDAMGNGAAVRWWRIARATRLILARRVRAGLA